MIEGGVAGGSAAHHADQRRTVAARLVSEAAWLEAVADDERTTAAHLERLSPAYAILHDLKLSGSQGNIDHVVVGPGGAFLVVTRRFVDAVVFRDGAVYAGERSLQGELEGLRAVSGQLSQVLGTPVLPVLGFHGGALAATAPPSVDGVFVCGAENLVRVITRASHTLLPPHKVTDVTEKALPMLFNPGSVARSDVPTRPEPPVPPMDPRGPVLPVLPVSAAAAPAPTSVSPQMDELARRRDETMRALQGAVDSPSFAAAPGGAAHPPAPIPAAPAVASMPIMGATPLAASLAPAAAPTRHKRSRGFVLAVVLSLCLVAATLGAAASMIWSDDKDAGSTPGDTNRSTTTVSGSSTVPGPLAASLPAPIASFSAVCPAAGAGWQLVADWPGDIAGLAQYDVEVQDSKGGWVVLAPLLSSAVTVASVEGQPPNATLTLRVTAVMTDGSRSINQPTPFTTPTSPC